jgi:hypothetical protein
MSLGFYTTYVDTELLNSEKITEYSKTLKEKSELLSLNYNYYSRKIHDMYNEFSDNLNKSLEKHEKKKDVFKKIIENQDIE